MSLYRCAICGSPHVVRDSVGGGFDYKKAAVGTIVFGAAGAVAGMDGKQTTVYKCAACGHTLTYDMPFETKHQIDECVMSAEARKKYPWDRLKQRYPNIEATPDIDRQMQQEAQDAQSAIMSAIKEINDEFDGFANLSKEELDADEALCEEKNAALLKKLEEEAQADYQKQQSEFEAKKQKLLDETRERKRKKQEEIEQVKRTIAGPGKGTGLAVVLLILAALDIIFIFSAASGSGPAIDLLMQFKPLRGYAQSLRHLDGLSSIIIGLVVLLILFVWSFNIIGGNSKTKKTLSEELPKKEKELEALNKREDDIINHPENVYDLKIESVKDRVYHARYNNTAFIAKRKRINGKLDRHEIRTLMAEIIELFFKKYKGEIRSKQFEEYLHHTIPDNLHEGAFRGIHWVSISEMSSAFGGSEGRLKSRSIETDIMAEHDTFFNKHAYLIMYWLEDRE